MHKESKNTGEYSCNSCEFTSNNVAQLWKHILDVHSGEKFQFDNKTKEDIVIGLVAEQNVEILEAMYFIKAGLKESYEQLAILL